MEQSAVSHHLRLLRHLGLVVGERDGRRTIYGLHDEHVGVLLAEAVPRPARAAWLRRPAPARSTSFMSQRDAKGEGREATEATTTTTTSHAHAHAHDTGTHTHARVSTAIHTDSSTARSSARARASRRSLSRSACSWRQPWRRRRSSFSRTASLCSPTSSTTSATLTAVPLGIAFFLRSFRGEKIAGLVVVAVIFLSAMVALYEAVDRFIHPKELTHLWALAGAGAIGFLGNEIAAQIRLRSGRRLASPALVADGKHARVDGFVSLGVIASAALVAFGLERADPVVGILITVVILRITWDAWRTIRATEPGEAIDGH